MTCRDVSEFLQKYLAGELPPDQHAAFEAHVAVCPDCVTYIAGYREAVQVGKASFPRSDEPAAAEVPDALVQAILAAQRGRRQ